MKWHDFINLEIDYDSPANDDVAYLHPFENMTEEELSHYYNDVDKDNKVYGKGSNVHSMTATVTPENKNDSRDSPHVFHDNHDHGEIFPALIKY